MGSVVETSCNIKGTNDNKIIQTLDHFSCSSLGQLDSTCAQPHLEEADLLHALPQRDLLLVVVLVRDIAAQQVDPFEKKRKNETQLFSRYRLKG
jgi:hypothetical protein